MNFNLQLLFYMWRKNFFSLDINKIFLFLATMPLVMAYLMEIFLDILPCNLCIWQRLPFFIIIFLAGFNLKWQKTFVYYLIIGLFFMNAGLAGFNTMIEIGWVNAKCDLGGNTNTFINFFNRSSIPCNMPYFQWLGFVSIAFLNMLYCLMSAIFSVFYMRKNIKNSIDNNQYFTN